MSKAQGHSRSCLVLVRWTPCPSDPCTWDLSLYLYLSLLTLLTGHLVQGSGTIPVCLVSTDEGLCPLRPQSGGYPLNLICLLVVWGDRQLLLGVPRSDEGLQTVTGVGLVEVHSYLLLFSLASSYSCDSSSSFSSSSLSLSSGPAPLPTLPSVISSLFSFYLLPAWTPVQMVI